MTERGERTLKLTIVGEVFRGGAVPISLLASKLQALQRLLYHAAASASNDQQPRRGPWINRYRESVELTFVGSHHSNLTVVAELPAAEGLLDRDFSLGDRAMDLVFRVGRSVIQTPKESLSLDVRPLDKSYLLRAFEELMPNQIDNYQVELENGAPGRHAKLTFSNETRSSLRQLISEVTAPSFADQPTTIVGQLVAIHVDHNPQMLTVRYSGSEIDCYYPDAMRDQVANLLAGSTVEVAGLGTLSSHDRLEKIDPVLAVSTVSVEPLRIAGFEHEGHRYRLREPILMTVEYADGLWVYQNEQLNLWGYAARREDALRELQADFANMFSEIAQEEDEHLTEYAQSLKRKIQSLVVSDNDNEEHNAAGSERY